MFAENLSDNEYHGLNLMLSAKLRVVTIFVLLSRQKYAPTLQNTYIFLYICNLSEVDIFFPKSSLPIFVDDVMM